jgi:hypothetical protein
MRHRPNQLHTYIHTYIHTLYANKASHFPPKDRAMPLLLPAWSTYRTTTTSPLSPLAPLAPLDPLDPLDPLAPPLTTSLSTLSTARWAPLSAAIPLAFVIHSVPVRASAPLGAATSSNSDHVTIHRRHASFSPVIDLPLFHRGDGIWNLNLKENLRETTPAARGEIACA